MKLNEIMDPAERKRMLDAALKHVEKTSKSQAEAHRRIFGPHTEEEKKKKAEAKAHMEKKSKEWKEEFERKMKDPKFKKEFEQTWSDFAKGEMERKLKNNYRGD